MDPSNKSNTNHSRMPTPTYGIPTSSLSRNPSAFSALVPALSLSRSTNPSKATNARTQTPPANYCSVSNPLGIIHELLSSHVPQLPPLCFVLFTALSCSICCIILHTVGFFFYVLCLSRYFSYWSDILRPIGDHAIHIDVHEKHPAWDVERRSGVSIRL